MQLIKKIKNWFKTEETKIQPELKTIQTLDIFDDVWIVKDNEVYKGWVYEKTKNSIKVIYNSVLELKIRYNRPYDKTIIEDNDVKLILNKEDLC